jgi:mRNA-degrading endonuclease RelE of RelBE toxin-antitoxin system
MPSGYDRLRVGRYRVLYTVTDDLIAVGHITRTPPD